MSPFWCFAPTVTAPREREGKKLILDSNLQAQHREGAGASPGAGRMELAVPRHCCGPTYIDPTSWGKGPLTTVLPQTPRIVLSSLFFSSLSNAENGERCSLVPFCAPCRRWCWWRRGHQRSISADGFHWIRNIFHSQHLKPTIFFIRRGKKLSLPPLPQWNFAGTECECVENFLCDFFFFFKLGRSWLKEKFKK